MLRTRAGSAVAAQFLLLKTHIGRSDRQKVYFYFVFPQALQRKCAFIVNSG